ncbi:Sensor protein kinase WalK [compost metagenome]
MSIKVRLRFSYIAMLVIPFILILALTHIYTSLLEGSTKYSIGAKGPVDKLDFYTQVVASTNRMMKFVNNQSIQNSDKFLDNDFLESLENNRQLEYTGLVIRKNEDIVYVSEEIKTNLDTSKLPKFNLEEVTMEELYEEKKQITLGQQDFYFKDGSEGSVFYILDKSHLTQLFKRNISGLFIGICLILVSTHGILTYLVYKSIIKPLKELENAANEIKQGNLDYKINIDSKDEIAQVGNSFENMRIRLKESIELQQQYEDNRKELISNISHDLKTPITSIKGYVEGIKDGIADTPEKMNKYINTIHAKAKYMDILIDDLFLFSKLDINKLQFHYQRVDFTEFMKDCIEELSFDIAKNNIELTSHIPTSTIMVKADVQKLKRVILNIIENSMKYKDDKALKIDINIVEKHDEVIVEIKDNGKGIDKEILPNIFERFYRGDAARETIGGGSGLGLAIVKKIIEEHQGEIWAESELNKGTSIFFKLKKDRLGGEI